MGQKFGFLSLGGREGEKAECTRPDAFSDISQHLRPTRWIQCGLINAVNVTLTPDVSFNPIKDIVPVALTATTPNILVVHPALGVSNLRVAQATFPPCPSLVLPDTMSHSGSV